MGLTHFWAPRIFFKIWTFNCKIAKSMYNWQKKAVSFIKRWSQVECKKWVTQIFFGNFGVDLKGSVLKGSGLKGLGLKGSGLKSSELKGLGLKSSLCPLDWRVWEWKVQYWKIWDWKVQYWKVWVWKVHNAHRTERSWTEGVDSKIWDSIVPQLFSGIHRTFSKFHN